MVFPIDIKEWRQLSVAEKVQRCKVWAEEARKLAEHANPDRRDAYIRIADDWERLGDVLDASIPPEQKERVRYERCCYKVGYSTL